VATPPGAVALAGGLERGELGKVPSARSLSSVSSFAGYRFPPAVILVAVRWYLRYGLSYRDVEELLAERGVEVDHVTIYRWMQGSRRCSSTQPGPVGTRLAAAGSSMRPT
jgi:hypothetical protein